MLHKDPSGCEFRPDFGPFSRTARWFHGFRPDFGAFSRTGRWFQGFHPDFGALFWTGCLSKGFSVYWKVNPNWYEWDDHPWCTGYPRCADSRLLLLPEIDNYFYAPSVATITAFIVCMRFSASSKTMLAGLSNTSSVTSTPLRPNFWNTSSPTFVSRLW